MPRRGDCRRSKAVDLTPGAESPVADRDCVIYLARRAEAWSAKRRTIGGAARARTRDATRQACAAIAFSIISHDASCPVAASHRRLRRPTTAGSRPSSGRGTSESAGRGSATRSESSPPLPPDSVPSLAITAALPIPSVFLRSPDFVLPLGRDGFRLIQ